MDIAHDLNQACDNVGARLTIRKHPKEYGSKKYDNLNMSNCMIQEHDAASIIQFIEEQSIVVSTYSTSLIIAKRMGCRTYSYQPNCHDPVRKDLYRALGVPIVSDSVDLMAILCDDVVLGVDYFSSHMFFNINQSAESFVSFIGGI